MTRRGVVTATLPNGDSMALTVIVPASCTDDTIVISADHQETIRFAMLAAGVEEAEFEFSEVESD